MARSTAPITASMSTTCRTSASRSTRVTAGTIHTLMAGILNVGLIGLGTVGGQVAERLLTWQPQLARRAGIELCLRKVLVRDVKKPRAVTVTPDLLTADPDELVDDPSIQILVEVAGGDEPMHGYLERAIRSGKHVVTANKVVMAKHGPELLDLAAERNVDVYFEAAVGGGIPLISTFRTDLQANRIERVSAVINGTTNYVLGRMATNGLSLAEAVREAQAAGYAEADPSDDVGGFDATYKLAILGSIAYEIKIRPDDVYREGIENVEPVDFRYARELGYAIKLIAHTQRHPGRVEARVHPAMVALDHPLAQVEGANNAVFVEGDLVGQVLLVGQGAGGRPTASAVVGDLIDLARSIRRGVQSRPSFSFDDRIGVIPMGEVKTRAYYRVRVDDRTGVLAALGQVFAEEGVSISSLIQKDAWVDEQTAELVVTTHPAPDASLQKARDRIAQLPPVHAVSSFLRVF
ncbi:MAG: homoserine dehydrogenase [Chloroflexi bacterium]|nr:MAG: homoserine dehydrogenase [Chloroflexota bacterium]